MRSKTSLLAATVLAAALVVTGCASEPAPAEPAAAPSASATPTPEPVTVKAGDVVTPEQVEQLVKSGDIIAGYPVGDELVAVQWGVEIPAAVREAVNENVNAAVPDFGTSTDSDVQAADWYAFLDAANIEEQKLGGIGIMLLHCSQSFSTSLNSFRPTWIIADPGPGGEYGSYQEAYETAEAWQGGRQTGKRMYVTINNLGCEQ